MTTTLGGKSLTLSILWSTQRKEILQFKFLLDYRWKFKTIHLGIIKIKEIYTGEYIVNKIEESLNKYELFILNVLSITCDNMIA